MKQPITLPTKKEDWKAKVTFRIFSQLVSLNELVNFQEKKIALYQPLDEAIEICIAGKVVAKGALITKEGKYFIKVIEIL